MGLKNKKCRKKRKKKKKKTELITRVVCETSHLEDQPRFIIDDDATKMATGVITRFDGQGAPCSIMGNGTASAHPPG
jgi:hypothetical protein